LSINELRDVLRPDYECVGLLVSELNELGYTCSVLHIPHTIIRINHRDCELDLVPRVAYVDVLGDMVSYPDVVNAVKRILSSHATAF